MAFVTPPQPPIAFYTTSDALLSSVRTAIEASRRVQDDVSKVGVEDATFENVLLPLVYDEGAFSDVVRIATFANSTSPDSNLRDVSREAVGLITDFEIETFTREDVFKLVDVISKRKDVQALDTESKYYLTKRHRRYVRNGLGIPSGPKRHRFKAIQKRLSDLSTQCKKNFNAESVGLWLMPAELDGVPEDVLQGLKKEEDGPKLWLTMKLPVYSPTIKYAKKRVVRKKVFIAFENKCKVNAPLLREIFTLRDEAARLLGYPNHAAVNVEERMAGSVEFVESFLEDLKEKLTPLSQQEIRRALKLKAADFASQHWEHLDDTKLYHWDFAYYDRILKEEEFSYDQNKVAEYFPLETTLRGMLGTFEQLLGLRFVEMTHVPSAWHEDVKLYQTWDESSKAFLGYIYFDLHPRDFKHNHNSHYGLQPGYTKPDGSRHYPSSALVCNFTKPLPNKPSLLKHSECVTLFHEIGHGIHNLVSQVKFSANHGTGVTRDFVEAPSKMLENWYWIPNQLEAISHHYAHLRPEYMKAWKERTKRHGSKEVGPGPPLKIPEFMVTSIVDSRFINEATRQLHQVFLAMFDWKAHSPTSHAEIESMDFQVLYNKMRHEITGLQGPDTEYTWGNNHAKFSHMWGSYDASYYGYLLSFSYACDMFNAAFSENPMDPEEGNRYRRTVLEKGGSQSEMQTLENFLGRKPNNQAMTKQLGLRTEPK